MAYSTPEINLDVLTDDSADDTVDKNDTDCTNCEDDDRDNCAMSAEAVDDVD